MILRENETFIRSSAWRLKRVLIRIDAWVPSYIHQWEFGSEIQKRMPTNDKSKWGIAIDILLMIRIQWLFVSLLAIQRWIIVINREDDDNDPNGRVDSHVDWFQMSFPLSHSSTGNFWWCYCCPWLAVLVKPGWEVLGKDFQGFSV